MDEGERAMAFSDLMIEFEKSTDLMLKKFGRLDNKIFEMGEFTDNFHKSTEQLESLYKRDIEQRREYFKKQGEKATGA